MQGFRQTRLSRSPRSAKGMTEERWKAEEYKADFRHAIGIMNQFFPVLLDKIDLHENDNVLEIGLGSGKWSAAFTILGCPVFSVDNNKDIIETVKLNFPQISKIITFINDDAKTLTNVPNKTFKLVFSEGLLEHFLNTDERKAVIINMYRKLIPGGKCLCIVPYQNKADDEIFYDNPDQLVQDFLNVKLFVSINGFELQGKNADNSIGMRFIGVIAERGLE